MTNTTSAPELDFEQRAMITASTQVLDTILPDNYNDLDDDEMDNFVVEHVLDIFEGWTSKMIWTKINEVAITIKDFHKSELQRIDK